MDIALDVLVIAILVAIVILVLLTAEQTITCAQFARREGLTTEECGISGRVVAPFASLSRFNYSGGRDSVWAAADMGAVAGPPENMARRCDETPGCIAFNSAGMLKSGILPPEAWRPGGGLYVRKCAESEPLYVELFPNINFATSTSVARVLVPPGRYPDINNIGSAPGVIGGKMPRNTISSMKVPPGLKVTIYQKADFAGWQYVIRSGDYPDMRVFKTGNAIYPTWNDEIVSLIVEYDPAP